MMTLDTIMQICRWLKEKIIMDKMVKAIQRYF